MQIARMMLMLMTVGSACPIASMAQTGASRPVKEAALNAFAAAHAKLSPSAGGKVRLVFDPVIVRGWWDAGIKRDTSTVLPVPRDSNEVAALVRALGGGVVTSSDLSHCGRGMSGCLLYPSEVGVVAISEPRIRGDTATLLLRRGPPELVGNGRIVVGRTLSYSLVRLVRAGETWKVICLVGAGGDFEPSGAQVEAKCVG